MSERREPCETQRGNVVWDAKKACRCETRVGGPRCAKGHVGDVQRGAVWQWDGSKAVRRLARRAGVIQADHLRPTNVCWSGDQMAMTQALGGRQHGIYDPSSTTKEKITMCTCGYLWTWYSNSKVAKKTTPRKDDCQSWGGKYSFCARDIIVRGEGPYFGNRTAGHVQQLPKGKNWAGIRFGVLKTWIQ
jgi:hypothetical protein